MYFEPDPATQSRLEGLCKQFQIRRLELVGSGANGKFEPSRSDLDFLVEYDRSNEIDIVEQYFGFTEALEDLFQRKIDVIEEKSIRNPYFHAGVNRARKVLYAA